MFIYVDDLIGVSHESTAEGDQLLAQEVIKGPLDLVRWRISRCGLVCKEKFLDGLSI